MLYIQIDAAINPGNSGGHALRLRTTAGARRRAVQPGRRPSPDNHAWHRARLSLGKRYGVMISDVLPGSPAQAAGLQARDLITAVDGAAIAGLPYYTALMYLHDPRTASENFTARLGCFIPGSAQGICATRGIPGQIQ
jgi:S1-C subfamily serine protease